MLFEEPAFLLHHKKERGFSFASAIIFDGLYAIGAYRLYFMLFKEAKSQIDFSFVYISFFIAYMLVMEAPTFFVNFGIIVKELLLENF